MEVPQITVFVRHRANCSHRANEFYKRCDCRKHLRWSHDGKQHRRAAKSRTWLGADRFRREIEISFERAGTGKPVRPDEAVTVRQAVEVFLKDKEGQNMKANGVKKFRRELNRLVEFCDQRGRFFLQDVILPDLTEFRSGWNSIYPSSRTRKKVQERLRGFFRYAFNAGYVTKNPAAAMSTIKSDATPTLPLEPAQYDKLLAAVPGEFSDSTKAKRVHAIVQCMRYSGLAISDAVGLQRELVRFDPKKKIHRIVTSRTKTGVDVSVPIPPAVAKEILSVPNGNPAYFFWSTGNGKLESAVTNWQHDLRDLFHAAGLAKGHPHQLRDTAACEWLSAGVPLEEVSRLLGHDSIKTTEESYGAWVKSRQDRLDDLVMATWRKNRKK